MWSVLLELLWNWWSLFHFCQEVTEGLCLLSGVCPGLPKAHSPHKSLSQLLWTKKSWLPVPHGSSDAAGECQDVMCKRLQIMDTGNCRPVMKNKTTLFTESKLCNNAKMEINARNNVWTWTPDTRGVFPTEAENISSLGKCYGFDILECI